MNPNNPFGIPPIDPSKMDPKLLMELSNLVRELPPEKLSKMQTLMHNMMAGIDVRKEMEEFERTLPPGFRERMMTIMARQMSSQGQAPAPVVPISSAAVGAPDPVGSDEEMNLREARLTLLRAVAAGRMSPEEAEGLLFPSG